MTFPAGQTFTFLAPSKVKREQRAQDFIAEVGPSRAEHLGGGKIRLKVPFQLNPNDPPFRAE